MVYLKNCFISDIIDKRARGAIEGCSVTIYTAKMSQDLGTQLSVIESVKNLLTDQ